jgi:DNA-directed RNA polymerase specialized sigma24 family protein
MDRDDLVVSLTRYIRFQANRMARWYGRRVGMDADDFAQAGMLGVLSTWEASSRRWDVRVDPVTYFGTIAVNAMRAEVARASRKKRRPSLLLSLDDDASEDDERFPASREEEPWVVAWRGEHADRLRGALRRARRAG